MSSTQPSIQTTPDELRTWLEELVRQLQFARLIAAVIALVTRLRDLNTELTKQLANLPRSERLRVLEAQLQLPWLNANSDQGHRQNELSKPASW